MSALAHPEWLAGALVTLLCAALAVGLARRHAARRRVRLLGGPPRASGAARDAALLLALAALLLALVGVRGGERERRVTASGGDLVILVDVSRSMDASDTPPSRLARALRATDELLAQLAPGDRVALAAFASRGTLLTPLSPDHDALRELLAGLDGALITPRGSSLAQGIDAALLAFEPGSERPRTLVVLSDGEDSHGGRDLPLAELARAEVRVHAAAFGSEAGAMLADHAGPLVDASGRAVLTRRTLAPLERLTTATGGELLRADAFGALASGRLASAVHGGARGAQGFVVRRERSVRVLPFAALAFALLLFEGVGLPKPTRRTRGAASAAAALALLAAGPFAPEAAFRLHQQGLALLEQGDSEAAARTLAAAALITRDPAHAAIAYYNLGVAELAAGNLEHARTAFFDALALAPDDAQARFDLEWTLAALARRPPPAPHEPLPGPQREAPKPAPAPAPIAVPPNPPAPGEASEAPKPPAPLAAEERQRLLDRLPDDPRLALRVRARGDAAESAPAAEGPAW